MARVHSDAGGAAALGARESELPEPSSRDHEAGIVDGFGGQVAIAAWKTTKESKIAVTVAPQQTMALSSPAVGRNGASVVMVSSSS